MNTLVTIATFQYPHQTYVIKGRLETEGIYVFLKDELTVQAHNFLSNAVGGIKLQVYQSDVDRALSILESGQLDDSKAQYSEPAFVADSEVVTNHDHVKCIHCQSENIAKSRSFSSIIAILYLFFGMFLPFFKTEYHCFDCGEDFKIGKQNDVD